MTAYYNEHDPYAAAWLRNLITAGLIADGEVDERDIREVTPKDLAGFHQAHFFAGIGGWSLALRQAGWPDERPVWTGSCPCQPFSAAGKGGGVDDERHLWPDWFWLIAQCKPAVIFGEQVASKAALAWFDLVQADLEGAGYAVGVADLCSAGVGAPHIRQRLHFVAHTPSAGSFSSPLGEVHSREESAGTRHVQPERPCDVGGLANTFSGERGWRQYDGALFTDGQAPGRNEIPSDIERHSGVDGLGNAFDTRLEGHAGHGNDAPGRAIEAGSTTEAGRTCRMADTEDSGRREERADVGGLASGNRAQGLSTGLGDGGCDLRPGPTNGQWRAADWLRCRDGKWRAVEPGITALAPRVSNRVGRLGADWNAPAGKEAVGHRVGRLRAYGNAINPVLAAEFIAAAT